MNHQALCLSLVCMFGGAALLPSAIQAADTSDKTVKEAALANATLNKDDAAFVYDALLGGMAVIKTSELALKRGLSGAEREFAQKMVDDHGKMNDELEAIARAKGVAVPTGLDEKMQAKVDELGKKNDKDFAEAYLECQVDAHKHAVSAFKAASESAKDADVKLFATKHLAHLEEHRSMVKKLNKQH